MSLRANFAWITTGRIVYAICLWAILMVTARLGGAALLGEYTYALAVVSPVVIFFQLNMRSFMATDARDEYGFKTYLTARAILIAVSLAVVAMIVLLDDGDMDRFVLILLVWAFKSAESFSDIAYGQLQKNESMVYIGLSLAFHGIAALVVMVVLLLFLGEMYKAVAGIFVAWTVLLLLFDFPMAKKHSWASDGENNHGFSGLIIKCIPLGFVMLLASLRINVPVYFLEANLGIEQVGYFSAIFYFFIAGNIVIGSMVQSTAPRLAKYYRDGLYGGFLGLLVKMIMIAVCIGVLGVSLSYLFGSYLLNMLYGDAFSEHAIVFVWIMVGAAVGYVAQCVGSSLTVMRQFGYQLISNMLGVIATLIVAYKVIPVYGMTGGAMSILAGTGVTLIFNTFVALSVFNLQFREKTAF